MRPVSPHFLRDTDIAQKACGRTCPYQRQQIIVLAYRTVDRWRPWGDSSGCHIKGLPAMGMVTSTYTATILHCHCYTATILLLPTFFADIESVLAPPKVGRVVVTTKLYVCDFDSYKKLNEDNVNSKNCLRKVQLMRQQVGAHHQV